MEEYQNSTKDAQTCALSLRDKHSWDEVLRVAKDAENAYLQAGVKGLRRVGRWITDHSEAVQPYIKLIPNEWYLSILAGGLKLVFGECLDYLAI